MNSKLIAASLFVPPKFDISFPFKVVMKQLLSTLINIGLDASKKYSNLIDEFKLFVINNAPENCWQLMYIDVHTASYFDDQAWMSVLEPIYNLSDKEKIPIWSMFTDERKVGILCRLGFKVEKTENLKLSGGFVCPIWAIQRNPIQEKPKIKKHIEPHMEQIHTPEDPPIQNQENNPPEEEDFSSMQSQVFGRINRIYNEKSEKRKKRKSF